MFLILLLAFTPLLSPTHAPPIADDDPTYLYKVTLVRATPGKLLDLIDVLKIHRENAAGGGDAPPFLMRHSQGDQWDLFLLYPMESYASYYETARIAERAEATEEMRSAWTDLVAWEEDLFAYGPALDVVQQRFADAGFFHIEIFKALPGMQQTLIEEREMENRYLAELDRPQNLIFERDQGAAWDSFTIGFYRDIKHFAESADIPLEAEDAAAKAAGFESVYTISPYLRSLIQMHHDTLANPVR